MIPAPIIAVIRLAVQPMRLDLCSGSTMMSSSSDRNDLCDDGGVLDLMEVRVRNGDFGVATAGSGDVFIVVEGGGKALGVWVIEDRIIMLVL